MRKLVLGEKVFLKAIVVSFNDANAKLTTDGFDGIWVDRRLISKPIKRRKPKATRKRK